MTNTEETSPLTDLLSLFSSDTQSSSILRQLELKKKIFRRYQENLITDLVDLDDEFFSNESNKILSGVSLDDYLSSKGWTKDDFRYHVLRPPSLLKFAEDRFSPGLEELFLSSNGDFDQVIYSLIRIKDFDLAQELWIRLEEGESSFSDLAYTYGDGLEASRKGIYGPMPFASIESPVFKKILRSLQPSQINPPARFGDWVVLIRLESLTPARFDSRMRNFLLNQQLDSFLDNRVNLILSGETPDPLYFSS